jgi:hypothetical protein
MKRAYSTPDIVFENFSLNENIASANSNCSRNISNMSSNECGLLYGEKVVFTIAAMGCSFKTQDGNPMFDSLCYHIPTAENRLFNS